MEKLSYSVYMDILPNYNDNNNNNINNRRPRLKEQKSQTERTADPN